MALRAVLSFAFLFVFVVTCFSGETTRPVAGIRERRPTVHALIGASVITSAGHRLENANIVLRDGVIASVGTSEPPADARIWDMSGKTIYPGFIDAYSEIETDASKARGAAAYWNDNIVPELSAADQYTSDPKENEQWRAAGFTLRLIAPNRGIIRGSSAIVTTAEGKGSETILTTEFGLHVRLSTGRSRSKYPGSPMGAVALARQAMYDAQWYADAWRVYRNQAGVPRPESNSTLDRLSEVIAADRPIFFVTPDEQYLMRADRYAREFRLPAVFVGSGHEYRRLDDVRQTNRTIVLPLNFPKAPNVSSTDAARSVTLEQLMHWDLAPENPARLRAAGIRVAITSHGLKKSEFLAKLRQAVRRGLSADDALAAITTIPAELLQISDRFGSITPGRQANLVVTNGDLFEKKTKILATWIDGRRYESTKPTDDSNLGVWKSEKFEIKIEGSGKSPKGKIVAGDKKKDLKELNLSRDHLTAIFDSKLFDRIGVARLSATILSKESKPSTMFGVLQWSDGKTESFKATKSKPEDTLKDADSNTDDSQLADEEPDSKQASDESDDDKVDVANKVEKQPSDETAEDKTTDEKTKDEDAEDKDAEDKDGAVKEKSLDRDTSKDDKSKGDADTDDDKVKKDDKSESQADEASSFAVNFPLGAFGLDEQPPQSLVAFTNANVWTCGKAGLLEGATVVIKDGQIVAVGTDVEIPRDATTIDCGGKHLTPGIIDCHSHMATDGGVNESAQAITAEVRIGDFIDSRDIAIYRQLAGGVTTANILHGSANPIGGQNQVVKLRWGVNSAALKFAQAPPGIKFALGENVKQSNWGDNYRTRYPQSRMGVEQLIRDAFLTARQYRDRHIDWRRNPKGLPPRKDLELDALVEILEQKRWIHCHSYRQDEILALLRTLESFNIRIGTLQHILEGYKIADAMQKHGAMGSSFSDWWGYKFEVYDAIPYNGSLMHNVGVTVSFNSDDRELARHLNHEAAKAVKYGGVPEQEALKFVTLNPAKQLRIDQFVGSLEVGKHADIVVWSGPPLSTLSACEQTWVDGRKYFDIKSDRKNRSRWNDMRETLVQKILKSKVPMAKPGEKKTGRARSMAS